jgi:hypothetical protein
MRKDFMKMQTLALEKGRYPRRRDWRGLSGLTGVLLLLTVLAMVGCASIGPGRVAEDRFHYTGAVAESWKSQMLVNLVKIRYGDTPVFLDVGQIVAGYSFQRQVTASANASIFNGPASPGAVIGNLGLSGQGTYNDSPTITFTPLAGERFARLLMSPIPPSVIVNTFQSSFPVDVILRLAVRAVNGIDNHDYSALGYGLPADPEFYALMRNLRQIQISGDVGSRLSRVNNEDVLALVFRSNLSASIENARLRVANILGLDPTATDFRVVYGNVPHNDKEIAILTRSLYDVFVDLSSTIKVPEPHVAARQVAPTPADDEGPDGPIPPLIQISHSAKRPDDAFVAVPYRGYWFFIDDHDLRSKNIFSFLMFLFTFVEPAGAGAPPPLLTIPTSR